MYSLSRTKLIIFAFVFSVFLTGCANINSAYYSDKDNTPAHKIFVMSDLHVMSSELIHEGAENSEVFKNYLQGDLKMLLQSEEVLDYLIQQAISQQVNLVLIPGDLTKDGEYVCHQLVSQKLEQLREQGIKVLVVPGNHDINNPRGVVYTANQTTPAQKTSVEQFAQLYKNFGYDSESKEYSFYARDPNSLSYCCEPINGLYMFCLDSCAYDESTETKNMTKGKLRQSTLNWIFPIVDKAKKKGKQVVVMMHHNLVEHFDDEYRWLNDYMVKDQPSVLNDFLEHDIELVLTGHVHAQDIAQTYDRAKKHSITEVVTSSAVSYPCSYNLITVNKNLTLFTVNNQTINSIPSDSNYRENAKKFLAISRGTIKSKLNANWSKVLSASSFAKSLGVDITYDFEVQGVDNTATMLADLTRDTLTKFIRIFFAGGEDKYDENELQEEFDGTIRKVVNELAEEEKSRNSLQRLINLYFSNSFRSIITDTTNIDDANLSNHTDDHNVVIHLKRHK